MYGCQWCCGVGTEIGKVNAGRTGARVGGEELCAEVEEFVHPGHAGSPASTMVSLDCKG